MASADCIRQGDSAFKSRDFARAVTLYSDVLEQDDDATPSSSCDVYTKRCQCLIELRNYREALKDASEVAEREPGEVAGHLLKGRCLRGLQQYEEAYRAYSKALEVDPRHPLLAEDLRALQKEILRQYEKTERDQEETYNAVTMCSQDAYPGDETLEGEEQERVATLGLLDPPTLPPAKTPNPQTAAAALQAATVLCQQDKVEEALVAMETALQYDSQSPALLTRRSAMLEKAGQLPEVVRTLHAVPAQNRNRQDWMRGGHALVKLQLPVMAEKWFRRATELSPKGDHAAAMAFQQVRVKRLYEPLCKDTPVSVTFAQFGRCVITTRDVNKGEIIMKDSPAMLAQTLSSAHLPACSHCALSLITPQHVFSEEDLATNEDLKKALVFLWPVRPIVPCQHCPWEKYCSEECRDKAWTDYHRVICPSVNAHSQELYALCQRYGDLKAGDTRVFQGWWNASFSPLIMARMWATMACEAQRLAKAEGRATPSPSDWSTAQAPLRRFIAFGSNSNAVIIPKMYELMRKIFQDLGEGLSYDVTEREFDGRYYQCTCNVQAFSDGRTNPLKQFSDAVRLHPKWCRLLECIPKEIPEAEFAGLFALHACMNHSCANNADVMDVVVEGKPGVGVIAKRAIKGGEEVYITYINTRTARKQRRAWLFRAYNFWCHCLRCQFEGDGPEVCAECEKKAPEGKNFPCCSRCKNAWYCCQACQKKAWKRGHKAVCSLEHSNTVVSSDRLLQTFISSEL